MASRHPASTISQRFPGADHGVQPMGRSAVNTLLALIVGLEAPSPLITLPTELVVRESTAPPR